MPMQLAYHVVDVFTQKPLEGNALAVFPDGRHLDDATMQGIAREMNLSETTFVLPPTRPDPASLQGHRACSGQGVLETGGMPSVPARYLSDPW